MKNKVLISLVGASLFSLTAFGNSVTTTVAPGAFVNLLSSFKQPVLVKQVVVSANTTNVTASLVDTVTNSLTYVSPAYTNTVSYATNLVTTWTNYYGVVQSYTNLALIDVTNNVVAASTNSYPIRLGVAALASTSSTYSGVNYYFNNGVWATNNSTGTATITLTY